MQDNGSKKAIWVDAAYGKWTPLNDGTWMLATTIGKMDQPFLYSPMVFDPDYTPEGAALQSSYKINDQHTLVFNSAAFVIDYVSGSSRAPWMYGAQGLWNANWTPKISSSLGAGFMNIVNRDGLGLSGGLNPPSYNAGGVPNNNQGNSRDSNGMLVYNYNPIIATASVTYMLDSFPLYKGAFPIKLAGEYMINPGADPANGNANNQGVLGRHPTGQIRQERHMGRFVSLPISRGRRLV